MHILLPKSGGWGAIKLPPYPSDSEGPARVPITKPERLTSSMSLSGRKICNRKPLVGSWLGESRIGTQQFVYCFALLAAEIVVGCIFQISTWSHCGLGQSE